LGISTSYLNQLEHNQRPLTAAVLLRISEVLGVDPEFFSEADQERLTTDLRAALADEVCGDAVPSEGITEVSRDHPEVARALIALHRGYREAVARVADLGAPEAVLRTAEPHDEVRDFFYAHHNHIAALDEQAERTAAALATTSAGRTAAALAARLGDRHAVKVVEVDHQRSGEAAVDLGCGAGHGCLRCVRCRAGG
jgi:transcriptional regulator with XRE-family HTH domain